MSGLSFSFHLRENRWKGKKNRSSHTSGVEANKAESHRAAGLLPVRLSSASTGFPAQSPCCRFRSGLWNRSLTGLSFLFRTLRRSDCALGRTHPGSVLFPPACRHPAGGGATMLQSRADSSSEYTRFRYDCPVRDDGRAESRCHRRGHMPVVTLSNRRGATQKNNLKVYILVSLVDLHQSRVHITQKYLTAVKPAVYKSKVYQFKILCHLIADFKLCI